MALSSEDLLRIDRRMLDAYSAIERLADAYLFSNPEFQSKVKKATAALRVIPWAQFIDTFRPMAHTSADMRLINTFVLNTDDRDKWTAEVKDFLEPLLNELYPLYMAQAAMIAYADQTTAKPKGYIPPKKMDYKHCAEGKTLRERLLRFSKSERARVLQDLVEQMQMAISPPQLPPEEAPVTVESNSTEQSVCQEQQNTEQ